MRSRPRDGALYLCLLLAALVTCARAAVTSVPCCNTAAITVAIGLAAPGDTLVLTGTYTGACNLNLDASKFAGAGNLTIRGAVANNATSGVTACTSAGSNDTWILQVGAQVTMQDVTIRGAPTAWGIQVNTGSKLVLRNVVLTGCQTALVLVAGGATTSAQVFSSTFIANMNGVSGTGNRAPGIHVSPGQSLNVTGSYFIDNVSTGAAATAGVAISMLGGGLASSVYISNCTFQNNTNTSPNVNDDGGTIGNRGGGALTVTNSYFTKGSTSQRGGAVFVRGLASATVSGCQFVANTATLGGAIAVVEGSRVSVQSCSFSGNKAVNGSGVWTDSTTTMVTVAGSTFTSQSASGMGSGVGAAVNAALTVTDSTFTSMSGCAVGFDTNAAFFLGNLSFTSCTHSASTLFGVGIVHIRGAATGVVSNCAFTSNTALPAALGGAGIGIVGAGKVTIVGNTFTGNSVLRAAASGANIFINGGPSGAVNLTNNVFTNSGGSALAFLDNTAVNITNMYLSNTTGVGIVMQNPQTQVYISNATILRGAGSGINLIDGSLTIDGFVIQNCTTSANGGGLLQQSGSVTLRNGNFSYNIAQASGGAQIIQGSLYNIGFYYNSASGRGGGASVSQMTSAASLLTFRGNTAGSDGGGLYTASQSTVSSATFVDNAAGTNGGAWQADADVTVSGSTFATNTAGSNGGSINVLGQVSITTSSFTGCVAGNGGGAINGQGAGSSLIAGTTMIGNYATNNGGALQAGPVSTYVLIGVTFLGNTALKSGGGAYVGSATASGLNFTQNTASVGGGMALNTQVVISMAHCFFTSNTGATQGGAVYVSVNSKISVSRTNFTSNTGLQGGALYLQYVVQLLNISYSALTSNSAQDGGALYISTSAASPGLYISDTTLNGNTATNDGGAINTLSPLCMMRTVVTFNSAARHGGGLLVTGYGASIDMTDTFMSGNSAVQGGGAFISNSATYDMQGVSSLTLNDATDGTGLWCDSTSALNVSASTSVFAAPGNLPATCSGCGCCATPVYPIVLEDPESCFFFPGRACNFSCATGYLPTSNTSMMSCIGAAVTYPTTPCAPLPCLQLSAPAHGTVRQPVSPVTGSLAIFTCDQGYELVGAPLSMCEGGPWNASVPTCQPMPCTPLTAPRNGTLSSTTAVTGENITVCCDLGFQIMSIGGGGGGGGGGGSNPPNPGSNTDSGITTAELSCLGYAWSTQTPECQAIECAELDPPLHGTVQVQPPTSTGSTAYFACDTGYMLVGFDSTPCIGPNWTNPTPECQPRPCAPLTALAHGRTDYTGNVTGDLAYFTCDEGYTLSGVTHVSCVGPDWVGNATTCEPVLCPPVLAGNTVSNCIEDLVYNQSCQVSCQAGASGNPAVLPITCGQAANRGLGVINGQQPICTLCPGGSYSKVASQLCTACPNGGHTLAAGATAQSDCLCSVGYYEQTPGAGDCVVCPAGGYCAGERAQPVSATGYYETGALEFTLCSPLAACTGNNTCGEGYSDYKCGSCIVGYYRLLGDCKVCPTDGAWRLAMAGIVLVLAAAFLIYLVKPNPISERTFGFVSITISISFIQVVSTFADLSVTWPNLTTAVYSAFSTLNFNIELTSPECVVTLSFWDKFQIYLLSPFIVAAVFILALMCIVVFLYCYDHFPSWRTFKPRILQYVEITIAAYSFFLTLTYLLLTSSTLSMFACSRASNGVSTLVAAPSTYCYDAQWNKNLPLGIFGIIFYLIGIPLISISIYLTNQRRFGHEVAYRSVYTSFQVKKYNNTRWFWELTVSVRKLAVVLVATFFPANASIQIASCCIIFFGSCVLTLLARPYKWGRHNLIECISLIGSFFLLFCGQLASTDELDSTQLNVIDAATVTVIVICLTSFLSLFLVEVWVLASVSKMYTHTLPLQNQHVVAHDSAVLAVLPGSDGVSVVTLSATGRVKIWGMDTLNEIAAFDLTSATGGALTAAAIRPSELVVARDNSTVETWNIESRVCLRTWSVPAAVTCLVADGTVIAAGCTSGEVAFWNEPLMGVPLKHDAGSDRPSTASPRSHASLPLLSGPSKGATPAPGPADSSSHEPIKAGMVSAGHSGHVTSLKIRHVIVYSGGADGVVRKWNAETGVVFRQWKLPVPPGVAITAVDESGICILAGTSVGSVYLINNLTAASRMVRMHIGPVTCLTVFRESYLSAGRDGSMFVCAQKDGKYEQQVPHYGWGVTSVYFVPAIMTLYAADKSGSLLRFHVQPEWNVKDIDSRIVPPDCCQSSRRKGKYAIAPASDSQPTDTVYQELDLLSRDLDLPPIPWRRLLPRHADHIAAALTAESVARVEAAYAVHASDSHVVVSHAHVPEAFTGTAPVSDRLIELMPSSARDGSGRHRRQASSAALSSDTEGIAGDDDSAFGLRTGVPMKPFDSDAVMVEQDPSAPA